MVPPVTTHKYVLIGVQATLYWLLLPEHTATGPEITGLGVALMVTERLLVDEQAPLFEVRFTEPIPAAPQITFTVAAVDEPLIVPPITDHE